MLRTIHQSRFDNSREAQMIALTPCVASFDRTDMANPNEFDVATGTPESFSLPTGQVHVIVFKYPELRLKRRYHDDRALHGAPFTVELANGQKIQGTLDETGQAVVALPAPARRVQFGPDARAWTRVDQTPNPDFQGSLGPGEVDAFVDARFRTSHADPPPASTGDGGDGAGPR